MAGVLSLFFEDQVLPYYGGALHEALPYAVNDFMYWELTCHAARIGSRSFDFGRSREGTGAYHFKRHWGFEPVPLPYQYILLDGHPMPNLSPSNPKMRTAVDLQQVRSVRPGDLQQLVADIGTVSNEMTRQSSSWQRFGDQLTAIAGRLDDLEHAAKAAPAEGDTPAEPAT